MQNNELICSINMFDSYAQVIYPDKTTEVVPSVGVITYLLETCQTEEIENLHLFGNEIYIRGLLQDESPIDYNYGKVKIKVN